MFYQKDAKLEEMRDAHNTLGSEYICDGDNKVVWIDDSMWVEPLLAAAKRAFQKGETEHE